MFKLNRRRKNPVITTSSMSDIGFLLLIFIMLISLMNQRHEVKIEYSEAKLLEKTQTEDSFEIWIERNGQLTVEGIVVSTQQLEKLIAGAIMENPSIRVHIIADCNTPYRYVDGVVRILQALQHRVVSFVVREDLS